MKQITFALVALALFIPAISLARIVPDCGTVTINGVTTSAPCNLCHFFLLIANIFDFIAYKLAPPMAVMMFLLAGVLFLTSGGSEDRASQAKKIFLNALIGLILVYFSWLIVHTLINVIGKKIDGFDPTTWNKFECK
jgi:4-amino-4-deoxy-L-arabinose transferase-like glycosyltransferase